MQIRELTYLPTGAIFIDDTFDTADLHSDTLAAYERWWLASASPAQASVGTPVGPLAVKFTFAGGGQALGTWTLSGRPVLSTVLLAGKEHQADAELNAMFLASIRNVDQVKRLAMQQVPFETLRTVEARPLVGGVFWPIIPPDQYQQVAPVTMAMAASFFTTRPKTGG